MNNYEPGRSITASCNMVLTPRFTFYPSVIFPRTSEAYSFHLSSTRFWTDGPFLLHWPGRPKPSPAPFSSRLFHLPPKPIADRSVKD